MLSLKNWENSRDFEDVNFPTYDVKALKAAGKSAPVWLHFGGGNLYRAFHAQIANALAEQNELKSGVVVCETFDGEVVEKAYRAFNSDILQVIMHEDGQLEKTILAATADALYVNPEAPADFAKAVSYFENPALQFTTFSITEKGYALKNSAGEYLGVVASDIKAGPEAPKHTMSIVASLLYKRFLAGKFPIAMVSTDNFSQNGKRFRDSVLDIAKSWEDAELVPSEFVDYLSDEKLVSFPWSMIDRITPNPSEAVHAKLTADGFADMDIIHTAKHTNIAPFTNTEVVHYLVIEDSFPNGRPALDKGGVILTDRATVDKADTMKVTTCLNPLHTALAINGCLLGYDSIAAELKDDDLRGLIEQIGYHEGLPVVVDPKIINPQQFIDELVQKRLPNPNIPDTPQRIASDTSQKVAIRYGQTIKAYGDKAGQLTFIPLTIASWLRYLLAVDDKGASFVPSPDPLLEELQKALSSIKLGESDAAKVHAAVQAILANTSIFDNDLYAVGLGEKVEGFFLEMLAGPDAVRQTIHKYLKEK